jgi:hypothetical protein
MLPKTWTLDPETFQNCDSKPLGLQSSISTAAPSVLDAAVRHFAALPVE